MYIHFRIKLNTFVQKNTLSPRMTCSSTVTFMLMMTACKHLQVLLDLYDDT